ncbi:MAG: Coenzyme PQQ synthesis protein E [Myxococcota bacterium]|nr:Coenzyme PQQ synthesis protein E [Myxococcota bacterium]
MRPSVLNNLVEQARGGDPKVHSLYLNLTEACNLRCPSCHVSEPDFRPPKDLLDAATCARVVEEAADLGAADLYMVGGEPLLHREMFLSAARAAKRRGLFCETTTNGTRFDDELIEELVRIRFDGIALSLDGATAGVNDYLRSKPGVFEAISRAARKFSEQKQRLGSPFPVLKFNTVLSNRNFHQLGDFIRLASELGVDWVVVQTLGRLSSQFDSLSLDGGQLASAREQAKEALRLADKLGVKTNLRTISEPVVHKYAANFDRYLADTVAPLPAEKFFSAPCFMPFYHIVVDHQGVVHPCWNHKNPLRETVFDKSLREIFLGPHFTEAREAFLRKHVPSFCANCCMEHVYTTNVLRVQGMTEVGQYAEAVALCDEVLEKDPDNLRYQQLRQSAQIARVNSRHRAVLARLEGAKSGDGEDAAGQRREAEREIRGLAEEFRRARAGVAAMGGLIPLLNDVGAFDTALELNGELLKDHPGNAELLELRASTLAARASRQHRSVLDRLRAALEESGGDQSPETLRRKQEDLEREIRSLEQDIHGLVREFRDSGAGISSLGGLVPMLNRHAIHDTALWLCEELLRDDPGGAQWLELRANTLASRAIRRHELLLRRLNPSANGAEGARHGGDGGPAVLPAAPEHGAALQQEAGLVSGEARGQMREFGARGLDPAPLAAWLFLLVDLGVYDLAIELADTLTRRREPDPYVLWARAAALEKLGRFEEAWSQLISAQALPTDDISVRATLADTRAGVSCRLGRFGEAAEWARKALDDQPDRLETRIILAYALRRLNRNQEAAELLRGSPAAHLPPVQGFLRTLGEDSAGEEQGRPLVWRLGETRVSFHFVRPEDRILFGLHGGWRQFQGESGRQAMESRTER